MKILEGYFSQLDLDRKTMTPAQFRKAHPEYVKTTKKQSTIRPNISDNDLYIQFCNYVNRSKNQFHIRPDGEFSAPEQVRKSMVNNFEKSRARTGDNCKVILKDKYIDGEWLTYVEDVVRI